jgi:BirA family biotin operon repressor/biotin-[acetyl-CoA-carboxylase] ligase
MSAPLLPAGWRLDARVTVGSTNEEAKRLALEGASEFTVVWALEQTSGRGRRGRSWTSSRGNLYLSIVLKPEVPPSEAAQIGFVASVALADTLREFVPPSAPISLKWPNDVLVNRRKVSGILPEIVSTGTTGQVETLVLGMGINVANHPEHTTWPATDLIEAGARIELEQLLERITAALDRWIRIWRAEGFAPVRQHWKEEALPVGEAVELRIDSRVLAGRFLGIDADGALVLGSADGTRQLIRAGEVFFPGL